MLLILFSPWTGSWLVRLPDPVMEYRAYSTVGGIALLTAPLAQFPVLATLYIAWCAARAAQRSFFHRHPVPFWLSAWQSGAHTAKVALNAGSAFQAAGRLPEALDWHKRTLALDPQAGVAAVNIGLLLELQARLTGNAALLPEALAAARAGRAMCSADPLVVQYAGMVEERCRAAGVT
jgi:tetratricopeptide (TPR) repeat protein